MPFLWGIKRGICVSELTDSEQFFEALFLLFLKLITESFKHTQR